MSSSVTRCPACSTRFRATSEQLAASGGMVRCGRCSEVFNAVEHLHDGGLSPQLSLLIAPPENKTPPAEPAADVTGHDKIVAPPIAAIAHEPEALAYPYPSQEEISAEPSLKQRRWPWAVGCLLLLLAFLAQALFFYRIEIAARLPGLKPVLTSYCGLLKCTIPLPKEPDLLGIESSDMEADPLQSNVITLSATLHNRATHAQAYPNLELSLTDIQDKVVARRTFMPSEYLKTKEDEKLGLPANREISVKLRLDIADINPAGYKLFLF